jgi:hypothetical protein
MSALNLENATTLYLLLKDYLYTPVANESAEVYAYSIAIMIEKKDARVFFEVLALGTDKTPESFFKEKPDTFFKQFMNILIDNKVISLKSFFEDV